VRIFSATELLDIWERAERQHPLDRALALLEVTCPEKTFSELAQLSIGQRDSLLFELRRLTFGSQLYAYTECPVCGAQQEVTINIENLLQEQIYPKSIESSVKASGFLINFRLPNSLDLAECINSGSLNSKMLLKRCILSITQRNRNVDFEDLPETVNSAVETKMAEADPLAEVQVSLDCCECGNNMKMSLDILSYFWEELKEYVKQLFNQVYMLARNYGWREADILAMSPWRRQYYLEMVT
jgi:hypothetical protein